jgi:hypothetical protein
VLANNLALSRVALLGGVSKPSGPYIAKAVHFDVSSYLYQTACAIADSYTGAMSCWFNLDASPPFPGPTLFYTADGNDLLAPFSGWSSVEIGFDFSGDVGLGLEIQGDSCGGGSVGSLITPGTWFNVISKWNTDAASGAKTLDLLLNGASIWDPSNDYDSYGAEKVRWQRLDEGPPVTGQFFFPGPPDSFTSGNPPRAAMSMADFQLWTEIDITLVTPALFISGGKPVNPAVASSALGSPKVRFSGDASTFGTNQGTAGAFTLLGSLTTVAGPSQ